MSAEEMNQQIGKALAEYSAAKTALARSDSMLLEIAEQHGRVAQVLKANTGEDFTTPERIIKNMGAVSVGAELKLLLDDGKRLAELLVEHHATRKRVTDSLAALRGVGFGNVE